MEIGDTANAVRKSLLIIVIRIYAPESGKVIYARTIYITGKGYKYILSSINGSKKK